jgi:hypothetical protein
VELSERAGEIRELTGELFFDLLVPCRARRVSQPRAWLSIVAGRLYVPFRSREQCKGAAGASSSGGDQTDLPRIQTIKSAVGNASRVRVQGDSPESW